MGSVTSKDQSSFFSVFINLPLDVDVTFAGKLKKNLVSDSLNVKIILRKELTYERKISINNIRLTRSLFRCRACSLSLVCFSEHVDHDERFSCPCSAPKQLFCEFVPLNTDGSIYNFFYENV